MPGRGTRGDRGKWFKYDEAEKNWHATVDAEREPNLTGPRHARTLKT
jgi:hypothetical protein